MDSLLARKAKEEEREGKGVEKQKRKGALGGQGGLFSQASPRPKEFIHPFVHLFIQLVLAMLKALR